MVDVFAKTVIDADMRAHPRRRGCDPRYPGRDFLGKRVSPEGVLLSESSDT